MLKSQSHLNTSNVLTHILLLPNVTDETFILRTKDLGL